MSGTHTSHANSLDNLSAKILQFTRGRPNASVSRTIARDEGFRPGAKYAPVLVSMIPVGLPERTLPLVQSSQLIVL